MELRLDEFPIQQIKSFLPKADLRAIFDAYLTVGGIPVYLERLRRASSMYLSLCQESASANYFFVEEFEKIFVSSFGANAEYRAIVEFLANQRRATRQETLKYLGASSGGSLYRLIVDLELCGFIRAVYPIGKGASSSLKRYQIEDPFLNFYISFIAPQLGRIRNGEFAESPTRLVPIERFNQWLGFAFERYCLRNTYRIAKLLDFAAVQYEAGALFTRKSLSHEKGVQLDLVYKRKDRVTTVCEIKYTSSPVGTNVTEELDKKLEILDLANQQNVQKVLISAAGVHVEPVHDRAFVGQGNIHCLTARYRSLSIGTQ